MCSAEPETLDLAPGNPPTSLLSLHPGAQTWDQQGDSAGVQQDHLVLPSSNLAEGTQAAAQLV
jgi:hypothetical protein